MFLAAKRTDPAYKRGLPFRVLRSVITRSYLGKTLAYLLIKS
jgi:hypothetical protein